MATFDNFDTDYSGMDRFNDIMANGGNIDQKRIQDFIRESALELADEGVGSVKHLDFGNGLSIVLAWEDAIGEDESAFTDGGYQICVSVRETESAPRVEEWKSLAGSVALVQSDEDNDYAEIAEELYVQVIDNDPEEEDFVGQDRDETIFDELVDFKGAFEEWKNNIEVDGQIEISDINLERVEANGTVGDGVVFTITEDIVEADMAEIDEYFTNMMPQSIIDFTSDKNFDYVLKSKNEIAFVVW